MNFNRQNSNMKAEELLARIRKVDPADDLLQRIELRIARKTVTIPLRAVYRVAASFLLIAALECTLVFTSAGKEKTDVVQQVDNQIYE